jgi:hypothetical protein
VKRMREESVRDNQNWSPRGEVQEGRARVKREGVKAGTGLRGRARTYFFKVGSSALSLQTCIPSKEVPSISSLS